jgi:hypothetical protein
VKHSAAAKIVKDAARSSAKTALSPLGEADFWSDSNRAIGPQKSGRVAPTGVFSSRGGTGEGGLRAKSALSLEERVSRSGVLTSPSADGDG